MLPTITALAILASTVVAAPQPPNNGPARELFINNTTTRDVEIQVQRPGFTTIYVVGAKKQLHAQLVQITDDRLVVATTTVNNSWKVLATASFNASESAWPVVSYALVNDAGGVRLIPYVMSGGGVKAVSPGDQDALDKQKDAVTAGAPKAGAAPTEVEKK